MDLHTINQVSKTYGISTRMLRYYEEIGLITSLRKDGYAYRVYDDAALLRLQQIIVLRKLRVPMKHIRVILANSQTAKAGIGLTLMCRGLTAAYRKKAAQILSTTSTIMRAEPSNRMAPRHGGGYVPPAGKANGQPAVSGL